MEIEPTTSTSPGVDLSYVDELPPWLTFDQFGRYSTLREALEAARVALDQPAFSVLDVGGWTRQILGGEGLPIVYFLPGDDVLVVDQVESSLPHYRRGDGTSLDFADDSFDFVTSADTLEHIQAPRRPSFIRELIRVSRYGVLLIAPFRHPVVDAAEEFLFAYIKAELGYVQQQLAEHRGYGLPDLQATTELLSEMGLSYRTYPSGYIHSWLAMMLAKHYLFGLTDDPEIHMRVDQYYIRWLAADERREPSYRHYVVTAKDNRCDWLGGVDMALRPTVRAGGSSDVSTWQQTVNWLIGLVALKRNAASAAHTEPQRALEQTVAAQQQQIDHLLRMVSQRDAQLADLQARSEWQSQLLDQSHQQLERVANGAIMRILNGIKRR